MLWNMKSRGSRVALSAVSALGVILMLAGCSSNGTSGPQNKDSAAPADTNLTIATTSSNQPAMAAVVKQYEKLHPKLNVTVNYADTTPYQSNLRTQLSAGTAPDVFTVWAGNGNPGAVDVLQKAGYLTNLTGSPWVSKLPPKIKQEISIGGKVYGLPSKLDAIGIIYNEQTLKKIGATIPQTWSQLLNFCSAAKKHGVAALALGNQTTWVTQLIDYALVANTVYAKQPDFDQQMAEGKATFEKSGWVSAMKDYLSLNKAGCFNSNPLSTDVNASYKMLADGSAIGAVQVLSSLPQIEDTSAKGARYGFSVLPNPDGGATGLMPSGLGVSFALNKSAKDAANGQAFINWLSTKAALETWFAASPGIPALQDSGLTLQPAVQTAVKKINSGDISPFPDAQWPNPQVQNAHLVGVQNLFSGTQTISQVLGAMQKAYDQK